VSNQQVRDYAFPSLNSACTIVAGFVLSGLAFAVWGTGLLPQIDLTQIYFSNFVLMGAILLFALAALRCVSVFSQIGKHRNPANGDWREIKFSPWRYAVLLLPAVFSALLLYAPSLAIRASENTGPLRVDLVELDSARRSAEKRDVLEGRVCQVRGMVASQSERQVTLFKFTYVGSRPDPDFGFAWIKVLFPDERNGQWFGGWMEVTGTVRFRKAEKGDGYITTMELAKSSDAARVDSDFEFKGQQGD
jgi:hypothetical protein